MPDVRGLLSPYPKADVARRFGAAVVDGLLVITCLIFVSLIDSMMFLAGAVAYLLLRDALFVPGQSVGKFMFSLLVVSLETGRPCTRIGSAKRNIIFIVPLLNLVVIPFEAVAVVRDKQGQRLGDRLAQTQVVEGLGARELIRTFQRELLDIQVRESGEVPAEIEP